MQFLRLFFLGILVFTSSLFAGEEAQESTRLEGSTETSYIIQTQVFSGLSEDIKKSAPLENSTKNSSLTESEPCSTISKEVQKVNASKTTIETLPITQVKTALSAPSDQNSGKTYMHLPSTKDLQPAKSVFFQTNIGVGFLYFSGLQANLMTKPVGSSTLTSQWRDAPLKGRLSYNRTPLFEYLLGYRFNACLKLALSYQHQGGVAIQTKVVSANPTGVLNTEVVRFAANLSLDAFLAKVYFELPFAMVLKNLSVNPYLAVGVGPGWQSWTQIQATYMLGNTTLSIEAIPLRQKISANAVWMIDMGLRMQNASPTNRISVLVGCKYNQWGQARSMGKLTQQGTHKAGLTKPLRVKTVYQFAPYLGAQWNFAADQSLGSAYKLKGKSPQVWFPYWAASKQFQCSSNIWTQFNAGIGFLYFSGLKANLMGRPSGNFLPATNWRDAPLKGRLSYNRTPLLEYLLGYRFNSWLKLAFSYQHQGGVAIQSKPVSAYVVAGSSNSQYVQFTSNLSLDSFLAKVYFELPFSMIWRSLSANPYLAVAVGPGWQSWTQVETHYMLGNTNATEATLHLRQKISGNAVWMVDMGLRVQSAYPNSLFSVLAGCKYNQWGQARSMGKMSQQGAHKLALTQPLRIKTVYQFAPYLGVQWNFSPDLSAGAAYKLKGKSPKVWLPYWVASKEFQCSSNIWTQFNAGIGFLYFSGLRANLAGQPAGNFAPTTSWGNAPLKGRLSYNRTPLFEYLLGYSFNSCLKLALSYQHQGGVAIQSRAVSADSGGSSTGSAFVQFTSNLSLDALLAKVYFELPFSMIWRSLSANPYLAVGVGPGWQSWSKIQVNYSVGNVNHFAENLPFRQKISANAVWMVDTGLRIQSAYPNSQFSVLLGCKYNQWGQARSMGKMTQQGAHKLALAQPLRIKTVYQFAPYLGVQWNF